MTQRPLTDYQKKEQILGNVLGTYQGDEINEEDFDLQKQEEDEKKAALLDSIGSLITCLEEEGVDISRVPKVDENSTLNKLEITYKILRRKNDKNRNCSFAEECILAVANGLEWLFDGEKEYFGHKPNVSGWSATVNVKLRRMKYDTSTFVSEIMDGYDFGHGTRIALELIPSFILYSKMKNSQSSSSFSDQEYNNTLNKLRDMSD